MKLYVCTIGGLFQKFTLNILSDFTVYNRTKRMGAWLIIIRYCCGKQCELLLNRFLIRDTINLIYCHLPLSSIIDDKIRPPLLFKPRVGKKFRPPHLVSQPPHLKKNFDPPPPFGQFEHWSWAFTRIGVHRPSLRFPYLVFSIRSPLSLNFNRVSSLRPTYRHPFGRPFTYSLFR